MKQLTTTNPPLPMPPVLFDASRAPDIVTVPQRTVIAIAGRGAPEGTAFQRSVAAIYGIGYTLKFARKKTGGRDFKIGPLEARWWWEASRSVLDVPRDQWQWELRIAVPDDVTPAEVSATIDAATRKKGGKLEGSAEATQVKLSHLPRKQCGRVLHVGPYATEGESFDRIIQTAAARGLGAGHAHVEVYLSDPRRTSPAKLKTVLLLELQRS